MSLEGRFMTIRDSITEAAGRLASAGIEAASSEAWLLLGRALNKDRITLLTHSHDALSPTDQRAFLDLVERRIKHEPAAQIIGEKEFWSLPFLVSKDVLCPRPDSETLIALALELLNNRRSTPDSSPRILDLGTGSGCLVLALLSELPKAEAVGVDQSIHALAIAKANGERLGLSSRVSWLSADWGTALKSRFDLIVSNPPYIESGDWSGLAPEIRLYEPRTALIAGKDGLDCYRELAPEVARLLAPNGIACFEHGLGQGQDVSRIMAEAGLRNIEQRRDLAGIGRCLAVEPASPD